MAESYSLEAILSARDTNFTSTMQSAQGAMGNMAKASSSFGSTMKGVISGLGVFKIASSAINAVTGSIDNAISRVDTLENSARVFENMGYGAAETQSMMESLNDSILGLPTSLNDAVSGVQLLASSMGDIGKSQEVFSAMNNAILGFGGSAQMVDNAIIQLSQSFSNNKIDAQTWNSMINSGLGPALNALAKEMGYTTGELKTYLSDGTISVEEFQTALIDLDKNGGGGLKSLQQIAQDSTKGIATSLANARTSITRGVANIITAIDKGLSNAGLGSISDIITGIGKAAEKMLTGLAGGIETLGNFIAPLVAGFKSVMGPIGVATEALGAFQSATDELTGSVADVTSIFAEWDSLTLEEKQVTVSTMGQDEMEELLNLLGVDFDAIPDEYTKEAYLNAYGKDALEELLWVTGEWHNLTFEEKRAVLEAQIENDEIREAIDSMELWDDTEFYSKLADINMNDNDSHEQIMELINDYAVLQGLDPIEIEADADGVEEIIANASAGMTSLGETIGKTAKLVRRGVNAMMNFFRPLKDIGRDVMRASRKAFEGYFEAFDKLVDGEWGEAWELFKDTAVDFLGDVVDSVKKNAPEIWGNLKTMTSNIWNAFNNIDWGKVYEGIGSFLDGIGEQVAKIDWRLVAGEVGGAISDFVAKSTAWLTENMPKALEFVQNVLLNPYSQINKDAGAVKAEIDGIIDAFLAGLGVPETIINWSFKIDLWPEILWDKLVQAWEGLKQLTSHEEYDQEITMRIVGLRSNNTLSESDIQEAVDREFGEGAYDTFIEMETELEINADAVVEINRGAGLQAQIDEEYGEGTYQTFLDIEAVAETYAGQGFSESKIDELIKSTFPKDYDLYMELKALPEISMDLDATSSLESQVNTAVAGGINADVPINPTFDIQSGGVGTSTAEAPSIDFSAITTAAQTAMTEVNSAIALGMATATLAMSVGSVAMSTGFKVGMDRAVLTAQSTRNQIVSIFSGLGSQMQMLGVQAGAGFNAGLASQSGAILSTARGIANNVSSTIRNALQVSSPSKVTRYLGEMTGLGLVEGLRAMIPETQEASMQLAKASIPDLERADIGTFRNQSLSVNHTQSGMDSKLDKLIATVERSGNFIVDGKVLSKHQTNYNNQNLGRQIGREARTLWGV